HGGADGVVARAVIPGAGAGADWPRHRVSPVRAGKALVITPHPPAARAPPSPSRGEGLFGTNISAGVSVQAGAPGSQNSGEALAVRTFGSSPISARRARNRA